MDQSDIGRCTLNYSFCDSKQELAAFAEVLNANFYTKMIQVDAIPVFQQATVLFISEAFKFNASNLNLSELKTGSKFKEAFLPVSQIYCTF